MSMPLVSTTIAPVSNVGYSAVSGSEKPSVDEERAREQESVQPAAESEQAADKRGAASAGSDLSKAEVREQQRVIDALSARDTEVRQHERAHQAASGGLAGPASYSFQRGPDGRLYAVGGEVSIDTSAVSGDPRATLEKAQLIIQAAMAPAEPSSQDYRVAASARAMAADARAQLQEMEDNKTSESAADVAEVDEDSEQVSSRAQSTDSVSASDGGESAGSRQGQDDGALGSVERRLIESGAYTRLYPPGTLFSQQA